MYCSTCGTAVSPTLTYCNRCGTELNINPPAPKVSSTAMESLVWAIVAVTIVGMGAVIGLMAVMKEVLHLSDTPILIFSLLFLATFVGVDFVFISLLRSKFVTKKTSSLIPKHQFNTNELEEGSKLRNLPEPAPSIVEHTTRTLETVDRKRHTG
jgi:hypothetical protein